MRIRNLAQNDTARLYDSFSSVSISKEDKNPPDYGFYEYPLTYEDFHARLRDTRLSICLVEGRDILAYVLSYSLFHASDLDVSHDLVLQRLDCDSRLVYLDQLYMKPGLPLYYAGRLFDTWTKLVQDFRSPGVVCAIPQEPWRNVPSTRFAIDRGFRREGLVKKGSLTLGIFTKPFWTLDSEINNSSMVRL